MGRLLDLQYRKHTGIRPDGCAHYECPECGVVTDLYPKVPVRASTPVRVSYRCGCGVSHAVFLHTRAARVEVDVVGTLVKRHSDIRVAVRVRNVSRSGILIEVDEEPDVALGDELSVKFNLGDRTAVFFKSVEVRRVEQCLIGAEFSRTEQRRIDRNFEVALAHIQLSQYQTE